jgi:hypothetical protein
MHIYIKRNSTWLANLYGRGNITVKSYKQNNNYNVRQYLYAFEVDTNILSQTQNMVIIKKDY